MAATSLPWPSCDWPHTAEARPVPEPLALLRQLRTTVDFVFMDTISHRSCLQPPEGRPKGFSPSSLHPFMSSIVPSPWFQGGHVLSSRVDSSRLTTQPSLRWHCQIPQRLSSLSPPLPSSTIHLSSCKTATDGADGVVVRAGGRIAGGVHAGHSRSRQGRRINRRKEDEESRELDLGEQVPDQIIDAECEGVKNSNGQLFAVPCGDTVSAWDGTDEALEGQTPDYMDWESDVVPLVAESAIKAMEDGAAKTSQEGQIKGNGLLADSLSTGVSLDDGGTQRPSDGSPANEDDDRRTVFDWFSERRAKVGGDSDGDDTAELEVAAQKNRPQAASRRLSLSRSDELNVETGSKSEAYSDTDDDASKNVNQTWRKRASMGVSARVTEGSATQTSLQERDSPAASDAWNGRGAPVLPEQRMKGAEERRKKRKKLRQEEAAVRASNGAAVLAKPSQRSWFRDAEGNGASGAASDTSDDEAAVNVVERGQSAAAPADEAEAAAEEAPAKELSAEEDEGNYGWERDEAGRRPAWVMSKKEHSRTVRKMELQRTGEEVEQKRKARQARKEESAERKGQLEEEKQEAAAAAVQEKERAEESSLKQTEKQEEEERGEKREEQQQAAVQEATGDGNEGEDERERANGAASFLDRRESSERQEATPLDKGKADADQRDIKSNRSEHKQLYSNGAARAQTDEMSSRASDGALLAQETKGAVPGQQEDTSGSALDEDGPREAAEGGDLDETDPLKATQKIIRKKEKQYRSTQKITRVAAASATGSLLLVRAGSGMVMGTSRRPRWVGEEEGEGMSALLAADRGWLRAKESGTQALMSAVVGTVQTALLTPVTKLKDVVSDISETVSDVKDSVKDTVTETVSVLSETVTDTVSETVSVLSETMQDTVESVKDNAVVTVLKVQDKMADAVDSVGETVGGLKASVTDKVMEIKESVEEKVRVDEDEDNLLELESFRAPDSPEFRGVKGMTNYKVVQDRGGPFAWVHDFYLLMLKMPLPTFTLGMIAAPLLLSLIFSFLYLPDIKGLALEDVAQKFYNLQTMGVAEPPNSVADGQEFTTISFFQVFMFSFSLATGLQPEVAPVSAYTLIVANVNALIAELLFVFLSGAVFARLSQPSRPVRCSSVLLVHNTGRRRLKGNGTNGPITVAARNVLMCRYVLAGPQPSELVDVKVDLTYHYNTVTKSGSYFRAQQSLKLVRSEIAYQNHGMLVRHVVDENSPLMRRSMEQLRKEDAIFSMSVVGLERSSMQSVFHVQHYSVVDGDVVWNAEFEDMMLLNKKNRIIVDQRKLSNYRLLVKPPQQQQPQQQQQVAEWK
eukprot:TRINITY_DN4784_c0_g1_i1.p1 TRINITY_DN4784_c0_g1~~TRINITY_DN4784_c0_g1_i1.p1  ORF type:complete len:1329 (+),score=363.99 TRINITY_DN4784_c0_g1_i1:46-3987(+)